MPGTERPENGTKTREKSKRSPAAKSTPRAAPGKKMVQARLPFKRMNPVPKEEEGNLKPKRVKSSQNASTQNSLHPLNTSTEDLENDCEMETEELPPLSKTVNGRGPLDQFFRKSAKGSHSTQSITIDLTEDSNSGLPNQTTLHKETPTDLTNGTAPQESSPPSFLKSSQTDHCNVSMQAETQEQANCAKLSELCSDLQEARKPQSNNTFVKQIRLPVVVLEKLVVTKPSPVEEGEHEEDSSAEEDSATLSSPSSSVSGSSPDGKTGPEHRDRISPSPATTPVHKVTGNKPSTEKKRQRDKEQEEKRRKLQAEKEERERVKEEAKVTRERAKEEAKKKKDEREKEKEKEKKEKKEKEDKEKAEKLRLKEEKKKEKLDALEAKQEEKRKKEEEKRLKDVEKHMKAGKAEITRFFQKPKTPHAPKTFASFCGKFAPFEIKKNMALAPLCRIDFDQEASEQLDELLQQQSSDRSFLREIKTRALRRSERTVVLRRGVAAESSDVMAVTSEADEVQVLEEPDAALDGEVMLVESEKKDDVPERRKFGRMKLLQFCENHRPAYWGTWNRKSQVICSRKPWTQDTKLLDYVVDSDEEWEEEEPGESLSHSEGDDDDEAGEDEEDNDGFFVPHGYLSEDEGASEVEQTDPENQKVRQKLKAKEWDELLSKGKKLRFLQPRVIGCVWQGSGASEIRVLQRFATCVLELPAAEEELAQEASGKQRFKDWKILSHLLPLLHGNVNGSKVIIQEFQECCRRDLFSEGGASNMPGSGGTSPSSPNSRPLTPSNDVVMPSKARLKRIISENSVYEKRPDHRRCWYVHADVLKSFEQEKLPVPCQWTYLTLLSSSIREDSSANGPAGGSTQTTPVSGKRKSAGSMSITQFMKRAKELETTGAVETDGFQADTEEEDDDDCIVVGVQPRKDAEFQQTAPESVIMEVTSGEAAGVTVSI
ncbi:chromatin assembly factor 1 subunit A [Ascaphus truei]|uniref:chromatin assembly factor 1 subunit A n=1 Tax=Ascaphus truei TaxID=8439 RepID=UPI003F599BE2